MKKCLIKTISFIIFSLIFTINCQSQNSSKISPNNEYNLGQSRDIVVTNGLFYDNGGKDGNLTNNYEITTFHAKKDLIEIYFTEYIIPQGAEIRIYNGKTNQDELFGVFGSYDKIWNVSGPNITIEYIPSPLESIGTFGWKGVIRTIPFSDAKTKSLMPESDCPGAIPLCQNTTVIALGGLYTDLGSVNDDSGTCYGGTGSGGSVWYSFTPQSNGPLDFTITPTGTTDYDFVVWDITNGCGSGQRVQVSCNYSLYVGTTGLGSTPKCDESIGGAGNCTTNDCTTDNKQSDCNRFNRRLNVLTTKQYAICVNFYSGSNDGFILTFKNEASSVNITDITPPFITNSYANVCGGASLLHIHFNEWVQCSTIQNGDFTLAGYTFTVANNYCVNGRTDEVDLTVSPALPLGTYSIHAQDILDFCGNNMNSNYSVVIGSVPVANAGADKITCKTPGIFGTWNYSPASQTLTATSGTSYEWSDGQLGASINVSPTATTTYTVTVANGACTATDNVVVLVDVSPAPNLGADQTLCSGFPITLTANGGSTYQWQSTTTTNFFGSPTGWTNIVGATSSTFTGSPGATIYYQVLVTSPNGCTGSDWIKITIGAGSYSATASPPIICAGSSSTLTLPASMTAYTWSGGPSNTPYVVSPATTTTYTVTSTTVGCTGTTTVTVNVHSIQAVTATASNPTPCLGDVVTLNSTPTNSSTNITENFEVANGYTLVNGTYNKWYWGPFTFASGTKSLYIGTAIGNNNYTVTSGILTSNAATNFAYKDYAISSYCNAALDFKWRCMGVAGSAELSVWLVPTTFTPVAGTAITAGAGNVLLGGPYTGQATYQLVNVNLLAYSGQNVRIVFQWRNTGGMLAPAPVNTAGAIDDIIYSENTTYGYSWTSVPAGFTSTAQSPVITPTGTTTYNLTTTRCDGCINTANTTITMCSPLPIELLNFDGKCENNMVLLNWSTASEINNDYFTIESSHNGKDYKLISTIKGSGNSNTVKNYSYTDKNPSNGLSYYRLKQTDFDGSQFVFKTTSVSCFNTIPEVNFYPNPFNSNIIIEMSNMPDDNATIVVYNMLSQKIIEKILSQSIVANGKFELNLDYLPNGIYSVGFTINNFSRITKVVKTR